VAKAFMKFGNLFQEKGVILNLFLNFGKKNLKKKMNTSEK